MNTFFKEKLSSPRVQLALYIVGAVCIAVLIFHAGFIAGSHNRFPSPQGQVPGWNFKAPGFGDIHFPQSFMMQGHGLVGTIQDISTSSITIQTREGDTRTIALTKKTQFRNLDGSASSTALSAGSSIMVLGVPDENGQISADVIRIVPSDFPPQLPPVQLQ
jgi:hypothetical protein